MRRLKILIIATVSITFAISTLNDAYAQTSGQPDELQAIYACKDISSSEERLSCYDNSVGRFQAAEKSGNVVTVSKTTIEKVERDAFGFNIPSLPSISGIFGRGNKDADTSQNAQKENDLTAPVKQAEIVTPTPTQPPVTRNRPTPTTVSDVTLNVRKTTEFGRDKTRFFMTNGQVWEQVGSTRIKVPQKKSGKDYTAEIEKAALGSFMMRVNGKGASIRVRRVR